MAPTSRPSSLRIVPSRRRARAAIVRRSRVVGHDPCVEWARAATIISALAVFTGLQAFWISHALERVYARFDGVDARFDRVDARLDRIDGRLDRIEGVVLREDAERIARLEVAHGG